MKQRFVIVADGANVVRENAITNYFKANNFAYWHWFSNIWLVVDTTGTWNVELLRDKVNELAPDLHNFVFRVDDRSAWAIRGDPDAFPWLHNNWSK